MQLMNGGTEMHEQFKQYVESLHPSYERFERGKQYRTETLRELFARAPR
jgi:hypothetical protein